MSSRGIMIALEGFKELDGLLGTMIEEAPTIIINGQRVAMRKVLDEMKALAPQPNSTPDATGTLRDALAFVSHKATAARASNSAVENLSEVGIRIKKVTGRKGRKPRYYWHLVEFGTFRTAARPYIRPAFDANVHHMIDTLKNTMDKKIRQIIARARAQRRGRK